MVVFGSPKRWDRWHITPQKARTISGIFPANWGTICHYHLLGDPKTTIDQEVETDFSKSAHDATLSGLHA